MNNNTATLDLLPVTPSMERFTVQANALSRALSLLPKRYLPEPRKRTPAVFAAFVIDWMTRNAHDEIGNYPDLIEFAAMERRAR